MTGKLGLLLILLCWTRPQTPVTAVPVIEATRSCSCQCPDPRWMDLGLDHCYLTVNQTLSWGDASTNCQQENAELASIHSDYEQYLINKATSSVLSPMWIGLTWTANGNVWSDGSELNYVNWGEQETGTCVEQMPDSGKWKQTSCNNTIPSLCKVAKEPTETPPCSCYCPDDRWWDLGLDYCYLFVNEPESWDDADQNCRQEKANLVSVHDDYEQYLITKATSNSPASMWLGLMWTANGFIWSDGSELSYLNWGANEPNLAAGACVLLMPNSGKWKQTSCINNKSYLCKVQKSGGPRADRRVSRTQGSVHARGQGTSSATTTSPPTCYDDSWLLHGGYCYKFVSASAARPRDWWASQYACRSEGGELVSIRTWQELQWITDMIKELLDTVFWIGGQATVSTGFHWSDGTPFNLVKWKHGEPNNVEANVNCVGMLTRNGDFIDRNCANLYGHICKSLLSVTPPTPGTTLPPESYCPNGWMHFGSKCVQFNVEKLKFKDASDACRQQGNGVNLISIHSEVEQGYFAIEMDMAGMDMWLGLSGSSALGWTDNTPVNYVNWAPGEPDRGNKWVCVTAYWNSGMWADKDCGNKYGYVCMMDQVPI